MSLFIRVATGFFLGGMAVGVAFAVLAYLLKWGLCLESVVVKWWVELARLLLSLTLYKL